MSVYVAGCWLFAVGDRLLVIYGRVLNIECWYMIVGHLSLVVCNLMLVILVSSC